MSDDKVVRLGPIDVNGGGSVEQVLAKAKAAGLSRIVIVGERTEGRWFDMSNDAGEDGIEDVEDGLLLLDWALARVRRDRDEAYSGDGDE